LDVSVLGWLPQEALGEECFHCLALALIKVYVRSPIIDFETHKAFISFEGDFDIVAPRLIADSWENEGLIDP
jgi:hypothetical protein